MKDGIYLIKTWEEMEGMEGVKINGYGSLYQEKCDLFTNNMEQHMPKNRIIKIKNNTWNDWTFSDWMIKCRIKLKDIQVIDKPIISIGRIRLLEFLSNPFDPLIFVEIKKTSKDDLNKYCEEIRATLEAIKNRTQGKTE